MRAHPPEARNRGPTMTALLTRSHRVGTSTPRSIRLLPVAAFGTDLVLISCAVVIALLGRGVITIPDATTPEELSRSLIVAGPLIMLGWVTAIFLVGGYRPQAFGAGLEEYQRLAHASVWTGAAVGIGCYVLRFDLSRGFFVLLFLTGIPALLLGRFALRMSIKRA